jgi:hypothetical protein
MVQYPTPLRKETTGHGTTGLRKKERTAIGVNAPNRVAD